MRNICHNCGSRRILKLVFLADRQGNEKKASLCRPCHVAIKAATRERAATA
jgi:formate dehydrogenase maturation protein FdhE